MRNSRSTLSNLFWKFAERISAQVVSLVVSIVLARVLDPNDYGIVAIVMVFITLANVFVSDGLGSALIQKKDADALDFSTVLFCNLGLSIGLYFVLFFAAPYISDFYGQGYELLAPVIRVLGLRLPLSAINSIQQAYVSREMIFRKFFLATFLGTVISAIVGISMAYAGYGVWALVAQYLVNTTVDTIVLQISLRKWPIFQFSSGRLRRLLPFGIRILGAGLLIQGYQEVRALILGKVYSSSELAYFDRGRQFPKLVSTNVDNSISAVLFSKMSQEQDDVLKVKDLMRRSIRFSSYLMSPMMIGLAVVAEPFVLLILTEKWLPCVLMMQVFCLASIFNPIHSANNQVYKAVGRSDLYFRLEIIKKSIEIATLLVTILISPLAVAVGILATNVFFVFINAVPNQKLIGYSLREQLTDVFPNIFLSIVMGAVVLCVSVLPIGDLFLSILIQVLAGILVYIVLSATVRNKEFLAIAAVIKRFVSSKLNTKYICK